MGDVHSSSEGAPGGLSADGQRRRMVGCGAPGSNVSRLSPSIPQTSHVKRLRRYRAASPLTPMAHSILLFSALLSVFLLLFGTLSHLHAYLTNMHSLSNKQISL